jgi:electron-transferring-flavoprotein dehydrogenase
LSGNVFEPRGLNELIPDWKEKGAPLNTPAEEDHFFWLTSETSSVPLPTPPMLHNGGNYIISLSQLCRWLGTQAEELGVDIFPGTPVSEALIEEGKLVGVATADVGLGKDGTPTDGFSRGMELRGKQVIVAEGCRGSLSEELMERFNLRANCDPQAFSLGIKEVWKVDPTKSKPGLIQHTVGWPLPSDVYGGSFLYHMEPDTVLVGLVVGLDYKNPYLNPYKEFQRFKHHPKVRQYLEGGERIQYGARCISGGGYQSIPKLTFPGGMFAGCSAGLVNLPKIKGSHTAIKSGALAGEAAFNAIKEGGKASQEMGVELSEYQSAMENSWVFEELKSVRNYKYPFKFGLYAGIMYSGLSAFILRGNEPWTFHNSKKDSETTQPVAEATKIDYPKPDGKISFDLLENLSYSGTNHHDQPSHLRIKEGMDSAPQESFKVFGAPESRFCPAGVYEYPDNDGRLVINSQNCVHCKCCSIKMPKEYIRWTVPEAGGGGPDYQHM